MLRATAAAQTGGNQETVIRPLRRHEWSTVAAWRAAHFADMASRQEHLRPVKGQRGFDDAAWMGLEKRGTLVAALSFTQDEQQRIRWCHDLYAAPSNALAGLALGDWFERKADADGYEIRGSTDPENVKYLELLMRRGYEIVAVEFRRVPREPSERKDSGTTASISTEQDAVFVCTGA